MSAISRRNLLLSAAAGAAALTLPGCRASTPERIASSSSAPAAGAFPATVTHRYGATTVPGPPSRVISLGQTDHDPAATLGIVPIALGGFASDYDPIRPWNASYFTGTKPETLNMQEIEFERIAALGPDLILAVMSGITEGDYRKLAAIAPTVAQPVDYGDWVVPCRPHTEAVGAALGRSEQAAVLVDAMDARFAQVRADNPLFAGKVAACVESWDGQFYVIGKDAPRTQFLSDIGLSLSPTLVDLVGSEYNAELSAEKLNVLDELDVVVWTTDYKAVDDLLSNKLVAALPSTQQGRYVLAPSGGGDDDLLYSMDWGTILSNGYAIDNAVPRFVAALDDDPGTDPNG